MSLQWYASRERGAKLIAEFNGATLADALAAERAGAADLAAAYAEAREQARTRVVSTLDGLILAYAAAPEFTRLAASTQRQWNYTMKQLRAAPLAKLSLRALGLKGARGTILQWRDTMAATPRKADYAMQVLGRVLNWAVDREYLDKNPIVGIETLYASDRAEIVWTRAEIDAVCAHLTEDGARAIRFMALTGLRRGDAIAAPWSGIDEARGVLVVRTSKGKRRRLTQTCELTADLLALLKETPKRAATILSTPGGKAWTADGIGSAFNRARAKAGLSPAEDGGQKRLHDIRGTTATEKVAKILADPKFQGEMGWSGRAAKTAAKYVAPSNAVALAKRDENDG
ncbi:MAG TPA: hypothetical protein PKY87_12785 [Terricaulis sp.]|nr:hypothetical protein [Terricaulis sp.]